MYNAHHKHRRKRRHIYTHTPVVELQGVISQGAQLLVVLVIADADDGHLAAVDGLDEVSHPAPVTPRHAIHLIHDQTDLQAPQCSLVYLSINASYVVKNLDKCDNKCGYAVTTAKDLVLDQTDLEHDIVCGTLMLQQLTHDQTDLQTQQRLLEHTVPATSMPRHLCVLQSSQNTHDVLVQSMEQACIAVAYVAKDSDMCFPAERDLEATE